jgi:septum formation protein
MADSATALTVVLGSTSPRRADLMRELDVPFEIIPSDVNEDVAAGFKPAPLVQTLAQLKAFAVARKAPGQFVIGSDTTISLDGTILGKPRDAGEAHDMLASMSGRQHSVLTAVALVDGQSGRSVVSVVETLIYMRPSSSAELDAYVATGEPMDKAGSYAIQGEGGRLIDSIEGCYNNVVGFPLCEVAALLQRAGVEVRADACRLPDGQLCPRLHPAS